MWRTGKNHVFGFWDSDDSFDTVEISFDYFWHSLHHWRFCCLILMIEAVPEFQGVKKM